jgi:hypothetical protein
MTSDNPILSFCLLMDGTNELTLHTATGLTSLEQRGCAAFVTPSPSIPDRTTSKTQFQATAATRRRPLLFSSTTQLAAAYLGEPELWAIRITSSVLSYVAFIAYFDRPRGSMSVDDTVIEVKQSTVPGAGLGLFCRRDLAAGTVLGTYPGVVIPLSQNLAKLRRVPPCEGYIWRFTDNAFVIDPTNDQGVLDTECRGGRTDGLPGSRWLFQSGSPLTTALSVPTVLCRINEPPLGRDVNVVTREDLDTRSVSFCLERNVVAGEEFFIDYGLSYDRSMYGGGAPVEQE